MMKMSEESAAFFWSDDVFNLNFISVVSLSLGLLED